jgi:hypothetical protein
MTDVAERRSAALVDRYRIERQLGEGGRAGRGVPLVRPRGQIGAITDRQDPSLRGSCR